MRVNSVFTVLLARPASAFLGTARRFLRHYSRSSLLSALSYESDLGVAKGIVAHASITAQRLQGKSLVTQKDDPAAISGVATTDAYANPVTVADFTIQAVILAALQDAFPKDRFIAEETSAQLLAAGDATVEAVVAAASLAALPVATTSAANGAGDAASSATGGLRTAAEVCQALDLGASGVLDGWSEHSRTWVLDPIDGTKGFVRGEQFAIALSLLDQGRPVIGLLGCPNLPPQLPEASLLAQSNGHVAKSDSGVGSLFWASDQQGAYACTLADGGGSSAADSGAPPVAVLGSPARLSVNPEESTEKLVRSESAEPGHSAHSDAAAAATALNMNQPPIRMDGQGKYGLLARGEVSVFIRLPRAGYQEYIWDAAAGAIIVQEAGGIVTDLEGAPLNFSSEAAKGDGSRLSKDVVGIVATSGAGGSSQSGIHAKLLAALKDARYQ